MGFSDLIPMKKNFKDPQEGDIFVLQPKTDTFYFGKVIQTNVESTDSFVNGMTLIFVYKHCSRDKVIPIGLEQKELLIAPIIVNHQPWRKGYFETIGNIEVSEMERTTEFGFWNILKKEYVDISGQALKKKPKYCGIYGLGSYGVVGKEVQKAIRELNKNGM